MRSDIIRIAKRAGARRAGLSFILAAALLATANATADEAATADSHAHHQMSDDGDVRRSVAQYTIPKVTLVRNDGKTVDLATELNDGRPVVLNFIYTNCTTICPMSSQTFEQFQERLGGGIESVHMMSISIDPEQDTPARLRAYASKFHAGRGWNHYSGTLASVVAVQTAFNAFRGDKMSHTPLTLMRSAPGKPWVRFDGFARADDLMAERKSWEASPASMAARGSPAF